MFETCTLIYRQLIEIILVIIIGSISRMDGRCFKRNPQTFLSLSYLKWVKKLVSGGECVEATVLFLSWFLYVEEIHWTRGENQKKPRANCICTAGSRTGKGVRLKPHGAILLITVAFMATKAIMKQRLKRKMIYLIRLTDMTGKSEKSYLHTLSLFQLFCDESNSNSS